MREFVFNSMNTSFSQKSYEHKFTFDVCGDNLENCNPGNKTNHYEARIFFVDLCYVFLKQLAQQPITM